jgi:stage III sporulation protein AF
MVNQISKWLLTIVGVVVIGVLIDLILPNGKISKYIKSIYSIIIIFVIISPLSTLSKTNFNINSTSYDNQINQNYLDSINQDKANKISSNIENYLSKNGFLNVNIEVIYSYENYNFKIDLINVFLNNLVIQGKDEHINKCEAIKTCILEYLGKECELKFYE